jgi:hypothetical protein
LPAAGASNWKSPEFIVCFVKVALEVEHMYAVDVVMASSVLAMLLSYQTTQAGSWSRASSVDLFQEYGVHRPHIGFAAESP